MGNLHGDESGSTDFDSRLTAIEDKLDDIKNLLAQFQVLIPQLNETLDLVRVSRAAEPEMELRNSARSLTVRSPGRSGPRAAAPPRVEPGTQNEAPRVSVTASAVSVVAGLRSPRDIQAAHPEARGVHWDDVSGTYQEGSGRSDCLVFAEGGTYWMFPTEGYLDHPSVFHSRLGRAFRWAEPKRGSIMVIAPAQVTAVTGGRFQIVAMGEICSAR